MIQRSSFEKYEQLKTFLTSIKPTEQVVILFSGGVTASGISWCPDCVKADPIIESVLKENTDKSFHFVHASVGAREEWRDPKCPFRTDPNFKLTSVPTLLMWGKVERLNDVECQDVENVRMIFENVSL